MERRLGLDGGRELHLRPARPHGAAHSRSLLCNLVASRVCATVRTSKHCQLDIYAGQQVHTDDRRTDNPNLYGAQIGAFAGCAAIIGVLFYWFNPSAVDDCSFNVGITVFTMILCVLVAMAPLHPSVRLPELAPSAIDCYVVC